MNAAIDAAWARKQVRRPDGVSWADWERMLAARRAEMSSSVEDMRHLGPQLEPEQVLLTVDEVLTRKPTAGHFLELCTVRIMTGHGYRYLSGVGTGFLQLLQIAMFLCLGPLSALLLIADGAR